MSTTLICEKFQLTTGLDALHDRVAGHVLVRKCMRNSSSHTPQQFSVFNLCGTPGSKLRWFVAKFIGNFVLEDHTCVCDFESATDATLSHFELLI